MLLPECSANLHSLVAHVFGTLPSGWLGGCTVQYNSSALTSDGHDLRRPRSSLHKTCNHTKKGAGAQLSKIAASLEHCRRGGQ